MRPVRLPRLRCALLGLLPVWARDGARRMKPAPAVAERGTPEARGKAGCAVFNTK